MPASPMQRIEFDRGEPWETRANTWVYAKSRYKDGAWRFREVGLLSIGDVVQLDRPDGPVLSIIKITKLPYKTQKAKKEGRGR